MNRSVFLQWNLVKPEPSNSDNSVSGPKLTPNFIKQSR